MALVTNNLNGLIPNEKSYDTPPGGVGAIYAYLLWPTPLTDIFADSIDTVER